MDEVGAVVMLVAGFLVIGGFVLWMKARARRAFVAVHGAIMEGWGAVGRELGLRWVVPEEHVREAKLPPCFEGRIDGRTVFMGLVDSAVDEDLTPKWQALITVALGHDVPSGRDRRKILKSLRRGRRAQADLKRRELRVLRTTGLHTDPARLVALVREITAAADALERLATA